MNDDNCIECNQLVHPANSYTVCDDCMTLHTEKMSREALLSKVLAELWSSLPDDVHIDYDLYSTIVQLLGENK